MIQGFGRALMAGVRYFTPGRRAEKSPEDIREQFNEYVSERISRLDLLTGHSLLNLLSIYAGADYKIFVERTGKSIEMFLDVIGKYEFSVQYYYISRMCEIDVRAIHHESVDRWFRENGRLLAEISTDAGGSDAVTLRQYIMRKGL